VKTLKEHIIQPERIERVVVRSANWVGDAVMTIPALRELRRLLPAAHLTLETRAWAGGIFDGADFIDELLPLDAGTRGLKGLIRQTREWRRRRFDAAVLFPNAFAPALVAAAARVPLRLGYRTDGRGALLTHPLPVPEWRGSRHEVYYYLNLVAEFERLLYGSTEIDPREPRLDLEVSPERREAARELLRSSGVRAGRPVVALCPGSTNSRAKRWPPERFAALADLLIEHAGAEVLLIGAREELEVSEEVSARMRRRPFVLTGRTSLAETTALLSVADLLITNDTGPAHLAAATRCPTIVIFGPTNPLTTRPFSDLAEVVREPPACAPCMLRDCPIDHRCMTAISPEAVFARARAVVGRGEGVGAAR
jgi:heptosyltransferase-2